MKTIFSTKLYEGKILNLRLDVVELDSRRITTREVVEYPGAVTIIPILEDKILLVNQFRYPIGKELLELPAGKIEEGESPLETARRELEEETGFRARKFTLLTKFYTVPGYSTEYMYLYLAEDLTKEDATALPDFDEIISVRPMNQDDAFQWLKEGRFEDAKTILGLLFYFNFVKNRR